MEIRQLQLEDFEASLGLSEYAFQFKLNGDDRVKSKRKFKPERVWGIFEEGELSAELTLLPLQVYVQGKAVSMGGIAGVATWPENRRQGLVAKLLSHTLQTMNESGHTLSFLHPFLIPFTAGSGGRSTVNIRSTRYRWASFRGRPKWRGV